MRMTNRDDAARGAGFTLLELMLTVAILPIILGAAYQVFITLSGNYSTISAQSEATGEAQRALDTLVREIRQAQEIQVGAGAFETADPTRASFYADMDRDGTPERITYYVPTNGTDLYRREDQATNPVYPYAFGEGPALRVVNLTTSSSVVFTYYCSASPMVPADPPDRATICAVGIQLSAARPSQNGNVEVDFTTRVKIRALFNSL
jgi:prepilin-type N-terminal cleavage/methylation domain-containing protein